MKKDIHSIELLEYWVYHNLLFMVLLRGVENELLLLSDLSDTSILNSTVMKIKGKKMHQIKPIIYFSLLFFVMLLGCATTGGGKPYGQHEVVYKNPNPKIEALHVRAFNYDLGNGVKQDRVKANKLYLQAAKAGDSRSMMNYAINRFAGVGIDANPVEAFYWIDRARLMTQRSPDMKMKWRVRAVYDDMKKKLTPKQIREAQNRRKNGNGSHTQTHY